MIHLHNNDAFAVMETLPDGKIDCLITDPPYGTTALAWDHAIDYPRFWREAERVTRETAVIVVFCAQPMMTDLVTSNRRHFRYELIWHKTMPVGFLDAGKRPLRAHENIAVFCRRWRGAKNAKISTYNPQWWFSTPYTKNQGRGEDRAGHYGKIHDTGSSGSADGRRHPISVLTYANRTGSKSPHPTAKPVELLKWLVATYSNAGDLVLDPYMGAGSTGIAARQLGRDFIGIELDSAYFEIARQRMDNLITPSQLSLLARHE